MGLDSLLGNARLRQELAQAIARDRVGHFYLISGPEGSGKHTLARLLAAALVCRGEGARPCLRCPQCRKVMDGQHPDFITVDDPGKKTVPVDLIRQARADIYVRPNEASRKIYLFPRAQDMGLPGQNALLKVLEEPPSYGVFLLLTDNPQKLLPTVRSRCMELKLLPLSQGELEAALAREFPDLPAESRSTAARRSAGYLGQAKQLLAGQSRGEDMERFARCYGARDPVGLLEVLVPMERWKREELIDRLSRWRELLIQALLCRSGQGALSREAGQLAAQRSSRELREGIDALSRCLEYARGNVSPGAVCGYLAWALR